MNLTFIQTTNQKVFYNLNLSTIISSSSSADSKLRREEFLNYLKSNFKALVQNYTFKVGFGIGTKGLYGHNN